MPFDHFRVGHAGAHHNKRATTDCNASFYKSPSKGQVVNSLDSLLVSWDTSSSCFDSTTSVVDMYLLVPGSATPRIHVWEKIPYPPGQYNAALMPRWWNSTDTVNVNLIIMEAGASPSWYFGPVGPLWTATYTAPASGVPDSADLSKSSSADGVTHVSATTIGATSSSHLSKGKIAAAVIMPLLLVVACIALWLKFSRAKGEAKRKEWAEAVDKRMSTISTDWKSMSGAGANAAIRNSIAISGNRNSSFSFGAIRPSSMAVEEGGEAGIGARSIYSHENGSGSQMSQLRPGLRTSAFENRVSRVSFATDTRPSMESRRSRAFHTATIYEDAPPVPTRQDSNTSIDNVAGSMSPRQTNGPINLSTEDIRTRIGGGAAANFDEVMPALSLMRTDGINNDEGSFYHSNPSLPAATHPKPIEHQDQFQTVDASSTTLFSASPMSPYFPTSPIGSHSQFGSMQSPPLQNQFGGMMMQPANFMSPDDMLKAYAERKAANTASRGVTSPIATSPRYSLGAGTGITYPSPAAGNARPLIPASPGSYSPSRGAYGVSEVDETIGRAE
ncbi:hypothetical protein C8J56DRAFT_815633 [Mycena floridula]|nr:hypothetical protein C8J56DRAFT_815633 [Mycena floridula]